LAGLTPIEAVDDVVELTNSVSVEVSGGPSSTPGLGDEVQVRAAYLAELADRDGTLLTTLVGGPGGGRVQREGDGYLL
jgi:hypothetical protein